MTSPDRYAARRRRLSDAVDGAEILLLGHRLLPRNYLDNHYPFRQDSSFLYFVGTNLPGVAAVIGAEGHTTLYLPTPGPSDALWLGELPPAEQIAAVAGADAVAAVEGLDLSAPRLTLPLTDPSVPAPEPSEALARAVIDLRLCHAPEEIASLRRACAVTAAGHRAAMEATCPGVFDHEVGALVDGVFALHGMAPSFPTIATARGEVLHGHARHEALEAGQLMLVDAGAEERGGCAGDVTRTFPVSGAFTPRQADIYDLVLAAADASIVACAPGVRYRDVHLASCRVIAAGLRDLGLLRGDPDGLVERGAHAAFFPHGVGHLLGLDVHDMELYGDVAGYEPGRSRSDQFGLGFLRLDRDLRPGMAVTIEPGIYFVPAILRDPDLRDRLGDSVAWDVAASWLPFGGVRIEDDVLITTDGHEILTSGIPRTRPDVEAATGAGPTPRQRMLARSG